MARQTAQVVHVLTRTRSTIVDGWLGLRAFVDLMRVDVALHRSGFWPVVARFERWDNRRVTAVASRDIRRARRYGRRIRQASWFCLPRVQCLHRSVVLHRWLQQEGLPSELCIGVLKDGNELKAHAWVEIAGQIVNDSHSAIRPFVLLLRQGSNGTFPDAANVSLMATGRMQWR